MSDQQGSYYAVIPSYVMRDKKLSANDKLVYGQIASLTSSKGYCWASNSSIGESLGIKGNTISKRISSLVERGYIARRVERNEKNEIVKRYLTLKFPAVPDIPTDDEQQNSDESSQKSSTPISHSEDTPMGQKGKTPISQRGKERLKVLSTTTTREIKNQHPLAYYQIAFGKSATGLLNQHLVELANKYGYELINYSFYLANSMGNGYPYAKAMFDAWVKDGLKTIEQVDQSREQFKEKQKVKKSAGKSSGYRSNVTPIKTKQTSLEDAVYHAYLNNNLDVQQTIKQFKFDGYDLTPEQIGGIYRERA